MRDFRYRHFEGWFTAFLAEAHRAAGDPAKARELAARALQVARDAKLPLGVAWALHVLGRVAEDIGDLDEADAHLVQAHEIFVRIQSRWERGRIALDRARLARVRGHAAEAAEHLREGRDIFRELSIPHYVERAEKLAMELNVVLD
jgi:tetratricopeptide (TPR) repeat protein